MTRLPPGSSSRSALAGVSRCTLSTASQPVTEQIGWPGVNVARISPLDLSIAKALGAWRRIFEVKYFQYILFATIMLKAVPCDRKAQPLGMNRRSVRRLGHVPGRRGWLNRLANCAGCAYDARVR